MKVTKLTETTGPWGLRATPGEYDGMPPLDAFLFDRQPRALSPDRAAAAAYLVFGHLASGDFETPQWHAPALAQAMVDDTRPAWVQTHPVELYAKPLPIGRRAVRVGVEGLAGFDPPVNQSSDVYELRIMRSDHSNGARTTFASLEISSNAWLHAVGQGIERRLRLAIACGVLFAEDLEVDHLLIDRNIAPAPVLERLRRLTDAVRLGVEEV